MPRVDDSCAAVLVVTSTLHKAGDHGRRILAESEQTRVIGGERVDLLQPCEMIPVQGEFRGHCQIGPSDLAKQVTKVHEVRLDRSQHRVGL